MSKFKVGQKVKLNPETKPYTFTSSYGRKVEFSPSVSGDEIFEVRATYGFDSDLLLVMVDNNFFSFDILDNHVIPIEEPTEQNYSEDAIEIRKFIVSELGMTHNTAEMQQVYEWITGEK